MAECPVDRKHQEIADLGDEGAAAAAVQEIKDDIKGIGDKLFIKGALHAIAEAVLLARGITFRQLLDGEGEAVAVRSTTQDIITGDPVEICVAHQKIEAAFTDPVFVVGKKGLRDPQLLGSMFLADALFFSQESKQTGKFRGHGVHLKSNIITDSINHYNGERDICKPKMSKK